MDAIHHPGVYVFCLSAADVPDAVATFREDEGRTVVVERARAAQLGLTPLHAAEWITLAVSSKLDDVGFLAPILVRLADAGISCNVFAGVHHDHLFVPEGRGRDVISLLSRV
jgi:hypothetical protein